MPDKNQDNLPMDRSDLIASYTAKVALHNGVGNAAAKFNVVPSKTQVLIDQIQLDGSFLGKIKIHQPVEQAGEVLGLGGGLTASTTDTNITERQAKGISGLNKLAVFLCRQVNFDVGVKYTELDSWAHLGVAYLSNMFKSRITSGTKLSLIACGFNGRYWSATSDRAAFPLLQDVQRGWLQRNREENFARCMGWKKVNDELEIDAISIGDNEEIKNLDALVSDMRDQLGEVHADRADLVVIVGRGLMNARKQKIINQVGHKATELNAASTIMYDQLIGDLPAMTVPYFPTDSIYVGPLENLAIYMQLSGHRRAVIDEPKKDQLSNYESMNIDFVIEDYTACAQADNVKIVD